MRTKKHRLTEQNYIGENIYFITIDLCDDYLKDEKLIYVIKDILDATVKKYDIANILTAFMYEHINFIFQGQKEDSHLIKCLKSFKSLVSINADIKSAAAKRDKKFWHKDFYDHIIRNEKSLSRIIRYVLENPVRKGYVENYMEWKYSFSDKYRLSDFANVCYEPKLNISNL